MLEPSVWDLLSPTAKAVKLSMIVAAMKGGAAEFKIGSQVAGELANIEQLSGKLNDLNAGKLPGEAELSKYYDKTPLGQAISEANKTGFGGAKAGAGTPEIPATSAIARDGLRNDLAVQAGIPRRLDQVWGASVDDLVQAYKMDGATLVPKPALSGTFGKAQAFTVEGHPTIKEVQVHPGGGAHDAPYYKFTYKDGTEVRIIDPSSGFKPGTITSAQQYFDTTGNRLRYEAGRWKSWV